MKKPVITIYKDTAGATLSCERVGLYLTAEGYYALYSDAMAHGEKGDAAYYYRKYRLTLAYGSGQVVEIPIDPTY